MGPEVPCVSVELKRDLDGPLHFVHLGGRKRAEFSDNDGLLDDGDPLRLDHGACLETGLREDRVFGAQGNPGFSRWVWKAGEDSDDRQVVPVASKDDRWPEFCGAEIGEGESDEDDITGLGGRRHRDLVRSATPGTPTRPVASTLELQAAR